MDGKTYYEYVCCTDGSSTGGTCGNSTFFPSTGDSISYDSGNSLYESTCEEVCTKNGFSIIVGNDRIVAVPKSASGSTCNCESITFEGTFSGNSFSSSEFIITTTPSTVIWSGSTIGGKCSVIFNIDASQSSGVTLTGIFGLNSVIIVALVLA